MARWVERDYPRSEGSDRLVFELEGQQGEALASFWTWTEWHSDQAGRAFQLGVEGNILSVSANGVPCDRPRVYRGEHRIERHGPGYWRTVNGGRGVLFGGFLGLEIPGVSWDTIVDAFNGF